MNPKFKLNCLKFVLDNGVQKDGLSDYQLAEQMHQWLSTETLKLTVAELEEEFAILPDQMGYDGISEIDYNDSRVKHVLRKINQDPERMKVLGNVKSDIEENAQ